MAILVMMKAGRKKKHISGCGCAPTCSLSAPWNLKSGLKRVPGEDGCLSENTFTWPKLLDVPNENMFIKNPFTFKAPCSMLTLSSSIISCYFSLIYYCVAIMFKVEIHHKIVVLVREGINKKKGPFCSLLLQRGPDPPLPPPFVVPWESEFFW